MNHVRTRKNKIKGFFLIALLFCALGCMLAGLFLLSTPNTAYAEAASETLSPATGNAALFLPEAYENYLDLSNPSSVAIGERYIAIADGKKIYVYDRSNPSLGYRVWEHKKNTEGVSVGKMQFTDEDRLFFSSASGLFELSLGEKLSENQVSNDFYPYTFLISRDILYVVTTIERTATILYRFKMDSENFALEDATAFKTVLDSSSQQNSPLLAYEDGTVYCSMNGTVYKYNGEDLEGSGNFSLDNAASGVLTPGSICALNGNLYFTDGKGLHRTDTKGNAELIKSANDISALYPSGDLLYCLWGKAVRAYDTVENKFTDYEIASSSSSVGRLSGATDIVRAGSLVVIADTANKRVTVYDGDTGMYSVLAPDENDFSPTLVATDGTLVAAVSESKIYVCNDPKKNSTFEEPVTVIGGAIEGIVCVYGKVYYVTQNNFHGVLGGKSTTKTNGGTPAALASDLYGNLYVAYTNETVRSFTEEQFLENNEQGTTIEGVTIPEDAKTMRAGFDGKLYYLDTNGTLCGADNEIATIDGKNFVYTNEKSIQPVSFALGYEDDEVYFLFGDFIVKTDAGALGFPSLGTISAKGVREMVFAPQDRNVAFRDVKKNSVGIRVDLGALTEDALYFPYSSYARTGEAGENVPLRGVLLDGMDKYALIALYEDKGYTVRLFREEDCVSAEASSLEGAFAERYLTSDAYIYYFPCITAAHAEQLPRGTKVKIVDIVQSDPDKTDEIDLGLDFAYVEYETGARAPMRGYLPLSFLTSASPDGEATEKYFLGEILPQGEGVVFTAEDGTTVTLTERTQVSLFDNGDGTYFARYERDGKVYTATVADSIVDKGESDALRIALIIILTVLALVIIGAYIYLLPRGKKKNKI